MNIAVKMYLDRLFVRQDESRREPKIKVEEAAT